MLREAISLVRVRHAAGSPLRLAVDMSGKTVGDPRLVEDEFVGDAGAVARLRALGVDYGQGYHLGRPQPIATLRPAAR